VSIYCIKAFN